MKHIAHSQRDQILMLGHMMAEQDPARIGRIACAFFNDYRNAKYAWLYLLDPTLQRLNFIAADAAGNVHWAPRASDTVLRLNNPELVCPMTHAIVTRNAVTIDAVGGGYDLGQLLETLGFQDEYDRENFELLAIRDRMERAIGLVVIYNGVVDNSAHRDSIVSIMLGAIGTRLQEKRLANSQERVPKSRKAGADKQIKTVIGHSPFAERIRQRAVRYAAAEAPMLITGPNGVGKEQLAREIHELSPRSNGRFIYVDLAVTDSVETIHSLAGHKRGALAHIAGSRTGLFKQASGGTIYLNNIDSADQATQEFILRVLEKGKLAPFGSERAFDVDARMIFGAQSRATSATDRSRIDAQLYFKIAGMTLELRGLDQLREDFSEISFAALSRYNARHRKNVSLSPDALVYLQARSYARNHNELADFIAFAADQLVDGGEITSAHLKRLVEATADDGDTNTTNLTDALKTFEKDLIQGALKANDGNRRLAAEALNIPKRTLAEKCKKHGL